MFLKIQFKNTADLTVDGLAFLDASNNPLAISSVTGSPSLSNAYDVNYAIDTTSNYFYTQEPNAHIIVEIASLPSIVELKGGNYINSGYRATSFDVLILEGSEYVLLQSITANYDDTTFLSSTPLSQQTQAQTAVDTERALLDSIRLKARLGKSLTLHETLTLFMSDSVEAQAAVDALNTGATYNDLIVLGLTSTEASRAIAVFYMQVDSTRYESEQALQALKNDPTLLVPFKTYLEELPTPLALPDLENYLVTLRSDLPVYNVARDWYAQHTAV